MDGASTQKTTRQWLQRDRPDLLRIARLVRYEVLSAWSDIRGGLSLRQRALLRRLSSQRQLKLHIASGPVKTDGWINVDGVAGADVQMDLRRTLPFAPDSASMIFCEHFLDHLQFPDVVGRFLAECHRVLEPGGRLRLVMHDGELAAAAYLRRDAEFFRLAMSGAPPSIETLNFVFRFNGFHQFIYDFETLKSVLDRAGFATIFRSSFRASEIQALNLDCDGPDRAVQSLYVEAVKSASGFIRTTIR